MRVTRSLMMFLTIAVVAAGCTASQPVAYYAAMTPGGIDGNVYGSMGTPVSAYASGYGYAQGYGSPGYAAQGYGSPGYAAPGYGYPGYGYGYGAATQSPYTLDSGDRLRVVVFGQDGLTNSYAVDASGHIAMPLIGSVSARGLTTDQLANGIAEKLRDGYVREPHVAVEIEAYRPFFILGEVTAPGQYPYVANMTVETAVAIAGGFGPRAQRQSAILIRSYNGQQMRMAVAPNYPLRPGDTINVQERWF
jgi:polysaccharide biosynthesis/export protein